MAPPTVLIGNSDFLKQREADYLYVDKSRFISEVLARPAEVQLYPRPRRFGKTLCMSMDMGGGAATAFRRATR